MFKHSIDEAENLLKSEKKDTYTANSYKMFVNYYSSKLDDIKDYINRSNYNLELPDELAILPNHAQIELDMIHDMLDKVKTNLHERHDYPDNKLFCMLETFSNMQCNVADFNSRSNGSVRS